MGTMGLVGTDRIRKKKRPEKGAQSHHHYSLGLCLQDGCYWSYRKGLDISDSGLAMGNGRANGEFAFACAPVIPFTTALGVHAKLKLVQQT